MPGPGAESADPVSSSDVAVGLAQTHGATTLEMYLASHDVTMPRCDGSPEVAEAWKDISQKYAEAASGEVRVVLGSELREGNVWQDREFGTLVANDRVDQIIAIDVESGAMSALFER